ncbi:MAG: hypothetical protein ACRDTC_23795, partial [Pseudonocardiaceae bacterium]
RRGNNPANRAAIAIRSPDRSLATEKSYHENQIYQLVIKLQILNPPEQHQGHSMFSTKFGGLNQA